MAKDTPEFIHSEFIKDVTLSDRISEFFYSYPYLHIDGGYAFRLINND